MSELVWGIKNGDLDQVKCIVESKPDGNDFDINLAINGRSPLHYAADYGQTDVLIYLLSKGASVDALDRHGITPILAAIWEGHTNCVKELLKNGASKIGKAPDGTSYLVSAESSEIKQLLG